MNRRNLLLVTLMSIGAAFSKAARAAQPNRFYGTPLDGHIAYLNTYLTNAVKPDQIGISRQGDVEIPQKIPPQDHLKGNVSSFERTPH